MNFKRKANIFFISNIIISLILVISLTVIFTIPAFSLSVISSTGISFATSCVLLIFIGIFILFTMTHSEKKWFKSIIPLIMSMIMLSLLISLMVGYYDNWEQTHIRHQIFFKDILGPIFVSIAFIILLLFALNYSSIFILLAISNDKYDEWQIFNFIKLTYGKLNIIKDGSYAYIYNDKNLVIVNFRGYDDRYISFEHEKEKMIINDLGEQEKTILKIESSQVVKDTLLKIEEVNNILNIKTKALLVYGNDELPKVEGKEFNELKIIKKENLFNYINSLEKENDLSDINKLIKKEK